MPVPGDVSMVGSQVSGRVPLSSDLVGGVGTSQSIISEAGGLVGECDSAIVGLCYSKLIGLECGVSSGAESSSRDVGGRSVPFMSCGLANVVESSHSRGLSGAMSAPVSRLVDQRSKEEDDEIDVAGVGGVDDKHFQPRCFILADNTLVDKLVSGTEGSVRQAQ